MAQASEMQQAQSIYAQLGVEPVINAAGHETAAGGSIMPPEVWQAMSDAAREFVMIDELNQAVGRKIAEATGAEAGYVTSGAAAGLLLSVAACIAGTDPSKVYKLPETDGLPNEVIMHRTHRINYDRMFRAAGGRIVEIGTPRGTDRWELEAAIGDRTACIAYVDSPSTARGALDFETVVEIARGYQIPIIVDAASTLPPVDHLRRWIRHGADLVVYSGGKGIRGPQDSGLLAGRADLIAAARVNGSPNAGIGRAAKVSKESMVGLAVALDRFLSCDHEAEFAKHRAEAEMVADAARGQPEIDVAIIDDREYEPAPIVVISPLDRSTWNPAELQAHLLNNSPRIRARVEHGNLVIKTQCFTGDDAEVVARAVARLFGSG